MTTLFPFAPMGAHTRTTTLTETASRAPKPAPVAVCAASNGTMVKIDVSSAPSRFSQLWGGPPGFDTRPTTSTKSASDTESDDGSIAEYSDPDSPTTATRSSPLATATPTMPRIQLPAPSRAKLERLRDGKCGGNSCHQCKSTKDAYHLFVCFNNIQGLPPMEAKRRSKARHKACRKKYCARCLIKFYRINPGHVNEPHWTCPGCQGFCTCASCRKRRVRQGVATRPIVRPGSPVPADDAEMLTAHGADREFAIAVAAPVETAAAAGAAPLAPLPPVSVVARPSPASKTPVPLGPLPDFTMIDEQRTPLGPGKSVGSPLPFGLAKSWDARAVPATREYDEFFALPPPAMSLVAFESGPDDPASLVPLRGPPRADARTCAPEFSATGGVCPLPFNLTMDRAAGPVITGSTVLHALAGQEPVRQHISDIVNVDDVDDDTKVDEIASLLRDIASHPRFCDAIEEADFFLS